MIARVFARSQAICCDLQEEVGLTCSDAQSPMDSAREWMDDCSELSRNSCVQEFDEYLVGFWILKLFYFLEKWKK